MTVIMSLKKHLADLEAAEYAKPPTQRRAVPSMAELAAAVGVSRQGIYTFAKEDSQLVNLKTLSAVISELRRQGFPTDVKDLLIAHPSELVEGG